MDLRSLLYRWSILLYLFTVVLLHSQRSAAQGEAERYEYNTANDSSAIEALLAKANHLQNVSPDSTISLAYSAFEKNRRLGDYSIAGRALGLIATAYRNKEAYGNSIRTFKAAIRFIEKQKTYREFMLAACYNAMTGAYFPQGKYDSAAMNCYKVIAIYNNARGRAVDPEKAVVKPLIDAYQYLSICWLKLGYHEYAGRYIDKALELSLANKAHYQLLSVLNNKCAVLMGKNDETAAYPVILQGREMAVRQRDTFMMDMFDIALSAYYLRKHRLTQAKNILTGLLDASRSKLSLQSYIEASYNMAGTYYEEGNYRKAQEILLPLMKTAADKNININAPNYHEMLAGIYKKTGNAEQAYEHLLIKNRLEDSLASNDKIQAMNLLDQSLQTAEKDKNLAEKQLQISNQDHKIKEQGLWIGVISFATVLILVCMIALYRNSRHKRKLQEERIHSLKKEQEIISLKSFMSGEERERTRFAMELHDGCISQLSAIKMNFASLPESSVSDESFYEYIGQLEEAIVELRKTAHNLMPEILLRGGGLVQAVQTYCERIAASHQIAIDFQVHGFHPRQHPEFELSVYRMVQEAVQNIVKHAKASHAIVQMNYSEGIMGITIEDDGCGWQPDGNKTNGLGLANLKARTHSLNGYFDISSIKGTGTTLYFEFDLNPDKF